MRYKFILLLLLTMGTLRSDIVPVLVNSGGVNCGIQNGQWTCDYSYLVTIAPGAQLTAADDPGEADDEFLTIYDFAGYLQGSATAPGGWSISEQKVGRTPGSVTVGDNAGLWNITFLYNGDSMIVGGTPQALVGTFRLSSEFGPSIQTGVRTAQTTSSATGLMLPHTGSVDVPSPDGGVESETFAAVPEPTTMLLVTGGLAALLTAQRRRG